MGLTERRDQRVRYLWREDQEVAEGWGPGLELGEGALPPQAKAVAVQTNPFSSFPSLRSRGFSWEQLLRVL